MDSNLHLFGSSLHKRSSRLPDFPGQWPRDAGQKNNFNKMNTLDATLANGAIATTPSLHAR
jgi:hypothetical protein